MLNGTQIHQSGGFETSTPLARIDAHLHNLMVTKKDTDSPCLGAAAFIQVPLGLAIANLEIRRIATARGIGMTNHQNAAAGLEGVDGVKTFG